VLRQLGFEVVELALALPDLGRGWGALMGAQEYAMVHEAVGADAGQLERSFTWGWPRAAATDTTHLAKTYRQLHDLNAGLADVRSAPAAAVH
jgi:hypothetical protein